MLSSHIGDEILELLVGYLFLHPGAAEPPTSREAGGSLTTITRPTLNLLLLPRLLFLLLLPLLLLWPGGY